MPFARRSSSNLLAVFVLLFAPSMAFAQASETLPLAVVVVVDGLSTEQLDLHRSCFGPDGFERILTEGAWFRKAAFGHAITFTAPGHATIVTGTAPRTHGLVANSWLDGRTGERIYCVAEPDYRMLHDSGRRGCSSRNLLVPAAPDLLHERSGGASRALAVSLKDRSAVIGAGRAGLAFWYDRGSGRFVTSDNYAAMPPDWWRRYHEDRPQDEWAAADIVMADCEPQGRHALHEASLPLVREGDPRLRSAEERRSAVATPGPAAYSALRSSTLGDRVTLDFALAALEATGIGRGERGATDWLLVSFSALDYVNHELGPDSPEASGVLAALDGVLADLLGWLDSQIGQGRWVLALTSDHGFPSAPEVYAAQGGDAGRLDPREMGRSLDARLDEVFGPRDWVTGWWAPHFYLNRSALESGIDRAAVEREARGLLEGMDGVQRVVTRTELESDPQNEELFVLTRESWHSGRSGDLVVFARPNWYLLSDPHGDAATHGSPHPYDRHVPLAFLGAGVHSGVSEEPARIRDLAPTLLALVGQAPGPKMEGKVLERVLSARSR